MAKKRPELAICYDFDGTLAPGNMQEDGFIPKINMNKVAFWREVSDRAKKYNADNILMYMWLMLEKAKENGVSIHRKDFMSFGKTIPLFPGVRDWFSRITDFGASGGVKITHHLITSGTREIVEGSPIGKCFDHIYASSFCFDHNDVAVWPAMSINYTYKTQFLFRINKGAHDVSEHNLVNSYVEPSKRPVPFHNIVYIGDGDTDVPCFRLVKDQGGHSIAVFPPRRRGAKERAQKYLGDKRVNFIAPANYGDKSILDLKVKKIIEKIAIDNELYGHYH